MHFALDDDVVALRDAVAAYLAKACPPEVVRAAWDAGGPSGAAEVWSGLAEMGLLGMLAPEAAGGLGLDEEALAAVLVEAGRAAVPLPLVETAAVAVPLLAASGDPEGILPAVVAGEVRVTVASPSAPASSGADWFVVVAGPDASGAVRFRRDAVLYRRDAVRVRPLTSVDRTRDLGAVEPVGAGSHLTAGPVSAGDRGALAAAAVLVGLGRGMVEQTVAYVAGRQQFGVPIGSFQAVKHRLADALLGVEMAAPAVAAAAHCAATGSPDTARSVSVAKVLASDAATAAAKAALQCHGAMGYTDEYHLHFWLKRAWCLAAGYGSAAYHRDRIGRALGLFENDEVSM